MRAPRLEWLVYSCLGAALCLRAAPLLAQAEAETPPVEEPGPTEAAAAPDATPAPAAAPTAPAPNADQASAEERYHGAFEALAHGERALAIALLRSLLKETPQHPLAARARVLLSALAAAPAHAEPAASERAPAERPEGVHEQQPTSAARAELVFFQTLHGIALGAELCAVAQCEAAQPWVLSMMLGAGAGFGLSFGLSGSGVRPGTARALTDGTLFGAANGLGLLLATGAADHGNSGATAGGFLALGQLGGLGIGALLADQLEPTAGQVSLTSSGGIWTLVATSEALVLIRPNVGSRTFGWVLLATGDLGLLAGGVLAHNVPMTTSRVLLIDAGGVLGTLTGLGLGVLVQGNHSDGSVTGGLGFVGTLVGVALAYHLTRDWDTAEKPSGTQTSLDLAPIPGGVLARVGGRF